MPIDERPLQIIPYPHPTLRTKARPIVRVDAELKRIAAQMIELMYQAKGVGLAATQVNIPIRMFVLNPAGERGEGEEMVLLNPELQFPKGSETASEGCLSLPGIHADVKRPKSIRLSAYDIRGNQVERTVSGFLARILQHESDHLDGVLFFDRIGPEARIELDESLKHLDKQFRDQQSAGDVASDEALVEEIRPWFERYTQ